MDMHFQSVVVSLVDENKKPFREYDPKSLENGRRCNVFMPENTEYKLLIKNLLDVRIKMDIEIDGSSVSGSGLILNKNTTDYIERFVDVAKKFKFVRASGPGSDPNVADPTSPENGIIKIRVHKEKAISYRFGSLLNNPWSDDVYGPRYIRGPSTPSSPVWYSTDQSVMIGSTTTTCCSYNASTAQDSFTGATVEGQKSDQKFSNTYWNGNDGIEQVFTFYIKGTANDQEKEKRYQEFLKLKQEFDA